MRAVVLTDFDAPPVLVEDLPTPEPADGELLVRVQASSANPVDNAIAAGMLKGMFEYEFPVVLGRDFAGVVEQGGPGVTRFEAGDEVFGYMPHADPAVHHGSWAELIAVPEDRVAATPAGVEPALAGATPLAGITALFCVDALGLSEGDSVLLVGATGGVGSFAVQLAGLAGAHVIAPAKSEDHGYLTALGVSELVDRDGDVAADVRASHADGVDAILDLVSYTPDEFGAYAAALKPDGRAASPVGGVGEGPGRHSIMASPDPAALDRLGLLMAEGALQVPVQAELSPRAGARGAGGAGDRPHSGKAGDRRLYPVVMATARTTSTAQERELLEAARDGDESAFGELVEPHRGELHAHCYRMLGSVHDAEDALQDALLRAWRGLARFEGRSSLRSWLYTIATNASLDAIARRPKRVLPFDHGPSIDAHDNLGLPLSETVWVEPYPEEGAGLGDGFAAPEARYELRESVELAFVAALQHLPANQRAALILREVLGFSAQETANTMETSVASVNSALQRARQTVDDRLPEQSQQATLRALGDERLQRVVESYMDAMSRGDVDAVIGMLAEDAAWTMPPLAAWFAGREALTGFLVEGPLSGEWRWRHLPARASGQAAVGSYSWYAPDETYPPVRAGRADPRRRAARRGHVVHRALHGQPRPGLLPALAQPTPGSRAGRGRLRPLRTAG